MSKSSAITPDQFTTFGDLLKFLRRRAGLSQQELSIAVGYSKSQISRLETNERAPDAAAIAARFVPALDLERERDWVARLLELAGTRRAQDESKTENVTRQTPPNRLPLQLTSFIGREKELAEIERFLTVRGQEHVRLVTLTGAGGSGKTRLALQLETDLLNAGVFQDGGGWVDLAPVTDPALVPQTIAQAVGVSEQPSRALLDTLLDYFRDKEFLLVLDNCEHLIQTCAELAQYLLQQCPALHILATSREPLNIAGELVRLVPPLSLPTQPTLDSIRGSDSGRLFVERAAAIRADFKLAPQNAAAIASICRQLDGVPLAVELAAARTSVLSVDQISARLDDGVQLLSEGKRTAAPRHRTLQATLDWSHNLLSQPEQIMFRRLAVFAGGLNLEAVEAICVGDGVQADGGLNLLTQLVNKSLVMKQEEGGAARFRMLEPIRQYAHGILVASDELENLRERRRDYFLTLAEQADAQRQNGDAAAYLHLLQPDYDNMRLALEWSLDRRNTRDEAPWRLTAALSAFWYEGGAWSEGRLWLDRVIEHNSPVFGAANKVAKATVLSVAGEIASTQQDLGRGAALLEESFALFQELDDEPRMGATLVALAWNAFIRRDYYGAIEVGNKAVALLREVGDNAALAAALRVVGTAALRLRHYVPAMAALEEALMRARASGDNEGIAQSLDGLADALKWQGEFPRARSLLEEAVALRSQLKSQPGRVTLLGNLAEVLLHYGEDARATALLDESLEIARKIGRPIQIGAALKLKGIEALRRGAYKEATAYFREELTLTVKHDFSWGIAEALCGFGLAAIGRREFERGVQLFGAADALLEASGAAYSPVQQEAVERAVASARAQLAPETFEYTFAAGRALRREQAIEYAMAEQAEQLRKKANRTRMSL